MAHAVKDNRHLPRAIWRAASAPWARSSAARSKLNEFLKAHGVYEPYTLDDLVERGIPIRDRDAAAPYRDLKIVEHFEAPEGGHDRALLRHLIEDGDARGCFLIFEIPTPGSSSYR